MTETPQECERGDASHAMRTALKLCLAGQRDEGLSLFRSALWRTNGASMPIALYARILQDAGQPETADRLRRLALHAGADLNISLFAPSATEETRLAEYRALFEAKIVNSVMIANYLTILSRMGMADEVGCHFTDEIIKSYFLADANDASNTINPDLIRDEILSKMGDDTWIEKKQSVRNAHVIDLVRFDAMPETRRLIDIVEGIGKSFKNTARKGNSLFWAMEPEDVVLTAWAVVSQGTGYNIRHLHPRGWLTGVFYAAAPEWALVDDNNEGSLRIGRPEEIPAGARGWPDLTIAPVPGRLILMPAYATHWTVPLSRPGLRVSVAMDFAPRQ
jgi:hypothetical protein